MLENSPDVYLLLCFPTETKLIKKKNLIKLSGSSPSPFSRVASEEADCETSQAGQRGSELLPPNKSMNKSCLSGEYLNSIAERKAFKSELSTHRD